MMALNIRNLTILALLTSVLGACTHTIKLQTENENPLRTATSVQTTSQIIPEPSFHTHSQFEDYTDSIAAQIMSRATADLKSDLMAVTSFGYRARDDENNHQLSYQLSQSIGQQLQPYGIRVINAYQTTDLEYLDATGLVLDDDAKSSLNALGAKTVLTGVITSNERGLLIQVKILDVNSKEMISSANRFVPYYSFNQ
ncbi:MAG: FlgO family outer membrane protein [Psychrobium sp.]